MRPGLLLGGGWALATAVAVAVAVQGVGFVGREVTDRRPPALSVEDVRAALRDGEPPAGSTATSTTTSSTSTTIVGDGPSEPATAAARPASGSRSPSGSGAASGGSGATPAAPSGGSGGTGTTSPAPSSTTRTYTLVGGSASVRFEPGKVTVLWATPNSGYEVDVETYAPDRVEVRFRSETHESELTAWWDGGARDAIEEEARSSDSGSSSD